MTTTYTVLNNNGDVIDSGLNAVEAMDVILTDDGHEWEIRPEADGEGFRLWTTTHSRNSTGYEGLTASTVYSLNADEEAAMQEIAAKVIAVRWPRKPEAMTDAAYAAIRIRAGGPLKMTTKTITIEIDAAKYEDHDDCLAAAVRDVQKARGLKGWALRARWADDNRETILIDVPAEAGE